ncbi:hypothetical protein TRIUR3_30218 [Triticum urartu]|uniref:Uncharacterized protein n=1 Tax=Triticum urartu TaxID=4572 RepID=M8AMM0_TRIUA|nr:hypothetical protein TRIUR3_30218 [Triticum urartu]
MAAAGGIFPTTLPLAAHAGGARARGGRGLPAQFMAAAGSAVHAGVMTWWPGAGCCLTRPQRARGACRPLRHFCSCKERLCSLNTDGKYNGIQKPTWTTQIWNCRQSDTLVFANDMCSLAEWPSHARRNCALLQDVGMNYRSFKDDLVVIVKRKLPLIGVRTWSNIHPTIYRLIVADMIDKWDLEDTPETEEKVLKIAKERYRCWRSTLSSTYKAYKTDAARLANLPEDLQPEEWELMIEYFGTDSKF